MVRRVPSNIGQWVPVELTLSGPRITVRIGEHGFFEAEDDTYAGPGCLGVFLCSFYESGFGIRNVVVDGAPVSESPWREDVRQPTNWFYPVPTSEDVWQSPASLLRFPGGELLLIYGVQGEGGTDKYPDERARPIVRHVRSTDGGHTWSQPEDEVVLGGVWPTRGAAHLTPGGRLIRLFDKDEQWLTAESPDRGRTWLQPVPVDIGPMPPHARQLYMGPQAFLNLADGSMVLFLYASHDLAAPDLTHNNWGAVHWQGFACRSTDDGHTWSAAVNLDNSARDPEDQLYDNLDLTEACSTQMSDGRILALIRPESSPWMWETWSRDGGATWGPCVRGPFPGYATPNMVRTSSGAVLVAHRLPTMSIHCSLDEGHIWDHGTIIDNAIWCMGSMCAVEPDLVLYCYMDTFERLMRAQFLRVTPAGLEPAPPGLGG